MFLKINKLCRHLFIKILKILSKIILTNSKEIIYKTLEKYLQNLFKKFFEKDF